jgi:hypothetical protein
MLDFRCQFPSRVTNRPRAGPQATSGAEGRTDLDTAKSDIGQRMSDVERRADLDQTVWNFAS